MRTDKRIINVIRKSTDVKKINYNDLLIDDLSMDSMAMVLLLINLEEEFKIEFNEVDMNPYDLKTVSDVVNLVNKYSKSRDKQ